MNLITKKLFERGNNFLGTKYPILGGAMTWVWRVILCHLFQIMVV